ncbi:TPA: fimbria/pilus periplasmic chaperone, partial [Escherichia coli]|nr:fimbria/pilus periplasmic chaperone [Escherichia coli]
TGGGFPEDRESLQWLCVKGIPPKHDDRWAEEKGADKKKADKATLQVNLSVSSCVKLFVRPPAVKGRPEDAGGKVEWTKSGNKLKGNNPTPFYINISELSVGGKEVKEHRYISPYSSYEYEIPSGASGKVSWTVITDYGGKSKPFESELKS